MTRARLPDRRPSTTHKAVWQTEAGSHSFYVTVGYDPATGQPMECFYGDGQKTGTQLRDSLSDACVLISMLMQHGTTLDEIAHSLATVPVFGERRPASPVGAVVEAVRFGVSEAAA